MKPRSSKNKGARLQKQVRDTLYKYAPELEDGDIRSTSMGAPGTDILLSPAARRRFPYAIEAKNVERLNIWQAIEQSRSNNGGLESVVVFSKNREKTYIAIEFDSFLELQRKAHEYDKLNKE